MSHIKRFSEDLSEVLGFNGEITFSVLEFGHKLMDLADAYGLKIHVENKRILLEKE